MSSMNVSAKTVITTIFDHNNLRCGDSVLLKASVQLNENQGFERRFFEWKVSGIEGAVIDSSETKIYADGFQDSATAASSENRIIFHKPGTAIVSVSFKPDHHDEVVGTIQCVVR